MERENVQWCCANESETWPVRKKIRWHFSGQISEWSHGCMTLR